ncbi:toxin-activating lysine-acyltransferase [Aliiroseovarius sp. 2305UL8-7]|uniref:toxin-activating lysine-acyltransferase n=1 Tax=Aliiroseovarius conchicola TaxID=3121637 RepID=UPI003529C1FE
MTSKLQTLLSHDGLLHKMPPEKLAQLKGEVLDLFLVSDRYREATIGELVATVLPPVHFNQFRIYRTEQRPIGWVSWAYMSDEDARGYMAGDFDFKISTWNSGEHLWFIDFIAPYGHALKIAEDLKKNVFPNQVGFAPDLEAKDGSKRIRKFFGAKVKGIDMSEENESFLKGVSG